MTATTVALMGIASLLSLLFIISDDRRQTRVKAVMAERILTLEWSIQIVRAVLWQWSEDSSHTHCNCVSDVEARLSSILKVNMSGIGVEEENGGYGEICKCCGSLLGCYCHEYPHRDAKCPGRES